MSGEARRPARAWMRGPEGGRVGEGGVRRAGRARTGEAKGAADRAPVV
jgi:hypothetical protein